MHLPPLIAHHERRRLDAGRGAHRASRVDEHRKGKPERGPGSRSSVGRLPRDRRGGAGRRARNLRLAGRIVTGGREVLAAPRPPFVRLLALAAGMRALLVLVAASTLGALALVLLAWWGHERIVWQPPGGPHPAVTADDVRRVDYRADDGQPLFALVVAPGARADPRGVLLAFHGNAERAADGVAWARAVARRTGWAVMLAESRGYAGLPGRPSHAGARSDAVAAHRWLRDAHGLEPRRIAFFGYSLGSAVAAELAAALDATERPAALVLQAPFTSTHDMARLIAPRWLAAAWPWIGRVPFDTRRRVAAADVPVWVVHGAADRVVPPWMGQAVHAAARRPGGLLLVPGADHTDVPYVGGTRYWEFLAAALAAHAAHPAHAPGAAP